MAKKNHDRLPPHSIEAEQGLLACILLDPIECYGQCAIRIANEDAFYDLRHRTIYEVLGRMMEAQSPMDTHSIQEWMKREGVLEAIGGVTYLSALPDCSPSAANLEHYLRIVLDLATKRKLLQTVTLIAAKVYDGDPEGTILEEAERMVLNVRSNIVKGYRSIRDMVDEVTTGIEEMYERGQRGEVGGLSTGMLNLDRATDGLHPKHVWVIAARVSVGKSAFAGSIVQHVAINEGRPCGIISLEMTGEQFTRRILFGQAKINSTDVRCGRADPSGVAKVVPKVHQAPIYVEDQGGLTMSQIRAVARRMRQKEKIELLVIDYLQLIRSTLVGNRTDQLDEGAQQLKDLAKELDIAVIGLAQLNAEGGIRGSSQIGAGADQILKLKNVGDPKGFRQKVAGMLTKARDDDARQELEFAFDKQWTMFSEWPIELEE